MLSPVQIGIFYDNVLCREEIRIKVAPHTRIRATIENMAKAFKKKTDFDLPETDYVANYNNIAYRCAYLHKFAPLHTCLVQEIFHFALTECCVLRNTLFSKNGRFNICSLGGGPGTDIIGIISACQPFGFLPCTAQIVDLMSGWKGTFNSIVEEFRLGSYGNLSLNLNDEYFDCSYVAANLLKAIDSEILANIRSADLIAMVKFISATSCQDTEVMIKTIFKNMKPGALVLFIDNAGGGFKEMISRSCDLVTIFGPLNHLRYTKHELKVIKYGYKSCFETRVTVQILMKSSNSIYFNNKSLNNPLQHSTQKVTNNTSSDGTIPYYEISDLTFSTAYLDSLISNPTVIFITLMLIVIIRFYYTYVNCNYTFLFLVMFLSFYIVYCFYVKDFVFR